MSNFSYVMPSGVWPSGYIVLHTDLQKLDQNLFKAPNFADGGTYAPSAVITLGGAGLTVTGQFTATGGATMSGGVGISGPVSIASGYLSLDSLSSFVASGGSDLYQVTTAHGPFTALQGVEVTGGAIFHSGSVDVASGAWTFEAAAPVQINGGFITLGNVQINDSGASSFSVRVVTNLTAQTNISGPVICSSTVTLTGAGAIAKRSVIGADVGNSTYSVSTTDVVYIPTITSNGTYFIDDVGATNGKRIRFFVAYGATGTPAPPTGPMLFLRRTVDGSTIWPLGERSGAAFRSIELMFIAGRWQQIGGTPNP